MSTYTALHVRSNDDAAQSLFSQWLKSNHGGAKVQISKREGFPLELYWDDFLISVEPPNTLVAGYEQPDWLTVHYNSFCKMQDIATELSLALGCMTVVVMAQSVSEAYFVSVHRDGEHLRTLEYAGDQGEWITQEGAPLPFEKYPLGRNLSEEGAEPFYVFGQDDVAAYCSQLGLLLWEEKAKTDWTVLRVTSA